MLTAVVSGIVACKASGTSHPTATAAPRSQTPTAGPVRSFSPAATARVAPSATVVARVGEPGLFTLAAAGVAPQTVAVQAGRPVSWLNADAVPHRIVSDEAGLFDTGDIAPGTRASAQLTAPGFHDWHDAGNPAIKGTIRIIP